MAQTEVTPISQDELSAILSGNVDSVITPTDPSKEPKKEEEKEGFKKVLDTDINWKELAEIQEEKTEGTTETPEDVVKQPESATEGEKRAGRKPSDIVSMVNELVDAGDIFGFEDGPIKTIEEAKDLIKLNVQESKKATLEDVWKEKVNSYSPQVQAILQYAERGGQDVTPLLKAISEIEKTNDFNLEEESGQEAILKEYYSAQGWPEDDIKEEIETAKDLGKLKTKAEKLLPKINQVNQEKIQSMMEEQDQRQQEADKARKNYLSTIKQTLDKDKLGEIKLSRQEKAALWDGLTDIRYTSWSGQPTNLFFKKLEELQAGDKADYDHFLQIVMMTLNKDQFKEKLKTELKTIETANTVRQLKTSEKKVAASNEGFDEGESEKKNVIKRGFRNPFG